MATTAEVLAALDRAGRSAERYRILPPALRRSHLVVLSAVDELGGRARVTDVAAHTGIKTPNVGRLLKETEAAGWTGRTSDPADRRIVLVTLTDAGVRCLHRYDRTYAERLAAALRPEEHPEYDVMIAAIDQALGVISGVAETFAVAPAQDGVGPELGPPGDEPPCRV